MKEIRICPVCNKEFEVDKSKRGHWNIIYCSKYCNGKEKRIRNKDKIKILKDNWIKNNRDKRNAWYRIWEKNNREKRNLKYKKWKEKNPHYHRDYHKRPKAIVRETEYRKTEEYKKLAKERNIRFRKNHPDYLQRINKDKLKLSTSKYLKSSKGIAKRLRHSNKRKLKFNNLIGKNYDEPNKELIEMVNNRDKVCIYCGCEFDTLSKPNYNNKYPSYDHLNPNLPFSKDNMVKCCKRCNSSKNDKDVLVWLEKKKFKVNPIINELLVNQSVFK